MKILIVGGTGTIGRTLKEAFGKWHEVITASRQTGDVQVDIADPDSIRKMYESLPGLDACVCTAGTGYYGDFQTMTTSMMEPGIRGKLLGQINLVLIGKNFLNAEGSFTLTSGIAAEHPAKNGATVAMINGGVNSFVLGAAQELKRDQRINAVSPGLAADSAERYGHLFPGYNFAPMHKIVNAYILSVEGAVNGEILKVYA
jgi:NAD(P)-dependent dehydrogenase (short-subunit alcohol dehydrogenase family)